MQRKRKCKDKGQQNLQGLSCTALFLLAALILSHAATLIATPVAAQQAAVLEEVIVTAQKREETLQEAPLAVTAFTQRDLEDIGAVEFGTVANKAPNITLRKNIASHSNYAFGIRGVSAGETALAVDSVVGLYIDGVYLGRLTGSAFDISDTERVEVLRGPQGTLYGRNAPAGAINIITNKPKEDFEFRNYLTGGERGLLRNQTTINTGNFPVAGGMLSARFNFSKWKHDGTVKNLANDQTNGDMDSDAGRLSLRWDSGDGLIADYSYNISEKTGNSQIQQITGIHIDAYKNAFMGAVGGFRAGAVITGMEAANPAAPTDEESAVIGQKTQAAIAAGSALLAQEMFSSPDPATNAFMSAFVQLGQRISGSANDYPIFRPAGQAASADRVGAVHAPLSQPETSEFESHALTVEWEMPSGVVFKSITSYREWDSELPNFGTDFGTFRTAAEDKDKIYRIDDKGQVVPVGEGELVSMFNAQRRSSQEQLTQEFQFSGNLELMNINLDWVGGFYYFEEQADEDNPQNNVYPAAALGISGLTSFDDGVGAAGTYYSLGSASLCGAGGTARSVNATDPVNLQTTPDDNHITYSLGGDPVHIATACFDNNVSVVGGAPVFRYGTDNESWALYWQGRYALDERTNITVGLRYTADDKEGYLEAVPVNNLRNSTVSRVSDDDSWSKFNWDISVDHQWSDEVNLYGRIATGYRAGGYNARSSLGNFADPVDEENIISYELGAKTQWFGDRLRANLTVFYAEYEDKQTSTFSPSLAGATSLISNFGEQTNQGVELEVLAVPLPGLTLGLNYGYTDVDIDEPQTVPTLAGPMSPTPPYAPETTVYAWAQYEFAPSDYGTLALRIDYDYADKFTISDAASLDNPANRATERTLWGARISLNDIPLGDADEGRLSVAFWGRNLKNEEYREFVIPFGVFSTGSYGELRSLGMDIVYDY